MHGVRSIENPPARSYRTHVRRSMAAGDEDPPLNPPDAVAPITVRDVSAARGDDKEEDPRIPPSKKRHGHQGDGLQQLVARLPYDALAAVLGRLAPRWLAASRCVCKAWRDVVDEHRLLRADLLPFSLAGIFVHFRDHRFPELFSRPSSTTGARAVSGSLDFLRSAGSSGYEHRSDYIIRDHCNGLVLLDKYVVNPATRRWNTLPPCAPKHVTGMEYYRERLVFDPKVSPHYEVIIIPCLRPEDSIDAHPLVEESEWLPSPCKLPVFSSRSGCWEERSFVREGDVAVTVGEMRAGWWQSTAVYWRGALYVCDTEFTLRISLSDNKYRLIKPPMFVRRSTYADRRIARSEKGVYFVSLDKCRKSWLQVWILNESCGQMEWMLKYDKDLEHVLACHQFDRRVHGPWILEDINYNVFLSSEDNKKVAVEEKFEWNSDNDDDAANEGMVEDCYFENKKTTIVEEKLEWNDIALDVEDMVYEPYDPYYETCRILGFHPYKEIVFFSISVEVGLAYHLNSSKVEVLGSMYPKNYKKLINNLDRIMSPFTYTPCWIEEFPRNN